MFLFVSRFGSMLVAALACCLGLPAAKAQEEWAATPRLAPARAGDPNAMVLEAIRAMPIGGMYAASKPAFDGLSRAITLRGAALSVDPQFARPSFCSSATYLVFVGALERMAQQGALAWDPGTLNSLLVTGQRDGQGIWGRWNANGPGTARLFAEMGLGRNFCQWENARPGDFMKIFWTDEIGRKERGHSVVYLGMKSVAGKEYVRFWSSNLPSAAGDLSGYGEKLVAKTKMARVIFSRLENPQNITRIRSVAGTDAFLASLLTKSVTMEDVSRMCGL